MKLIVGLGNPGSKYHLTRHNTGYMFIDYLLKNDLLDNQTKTLKPETYMNSSGNAVYKKLNFYKLTLGNLLVVHDDLDLRLGEYKLQMARGPKLHNGIKSVEQALGSVDFWRLRLGVDNRDEENRTSGENYVLEPFKKSELIILKDVVFPKAAGQIISFVKK